MPRPVQEAATATSGVAVSDKPGDALLDAPDQRPTHEAFETLYTELWGEACVWYITMPPSVSRHTGKVLKITPKTKNKKDSYITYTGLWGEAGVCNITRPPIVPKHTG
jgi:hypothetical protein